MNAGMNEFNYTLYILHYKLYIILRSSLNKNVAKANFFGTINPRAKAAWLYWNLWIRLPY